MPPIRTFQIPIKTEDSTNAILIHGILFVLCMLVFFPISIVSVKLARRWNYWFPTHLVSALLATLLLIIGLAYGIVPTKSTKVISSHGIVGILTTILVLLEFLSGIIISYLWEDDRTEIPWYNHVHNY